MRLRARTDANHADIVDALRKCGWTVVDTSRLGHGVPDLLIARRGVLLQIEVKDGTKKLSAQQLTPDEAEYHSNMLAAGCPVRLVRTVDEALSL